MLVIVTAVGRMTLSIVQIVDMVAVLDCDMAAAWTMHMPVLVRCGVG